MVKIVEPSASLIWVTPNAEKTIVDIARTCYKSEGTPESDARLLQRLLANFHLAMFDHASASIRFITDRGISHEAVRHRKANFAQESTRYCNYTQEKFGNEITVVKPLGITTTSYEAWIGACKESERAYRQLLDVCKDISPQVARSVLPTCLKTELVVTCTFSTWINFFRERLSPRAHPDMVLLARQALEILQIEAPNVFKEENIVDNDWWARRRETQC